MMNSGSSRALLAAGDSKLLDNESKVTYETLLKTAEEEVGSLQKRIEDGDFAGVYNAAGSIKGRLTTAEQEITQKIEQAKALAAEKAKTEGVDNETSEITETIEKIL